MTKIVISSKPLNKITTDLVVAVDDSKEALFQSDNDSELSKKLSSAIRAFRNGNCRKEFLHHFDNNNSAKALLVFSSSSHRAHDLLESIKIFAARSLSVASDYGYSRVTFLLNGDKGINFVGAVTEGFVLGDYRFDKYLREKSATKIKVELVCKERVRRKANRDLKRAQIISNEVNRARDLVNEPGDQVYPSTLARFARKIAKDRNLGIAVIRGARLEKQRYNGLVAVGKGSVYPPCLIVLRYRPGKGSKRHLALVGKGITFDTGGISIKPSEEMWTMKGDMAGAAAVLGAMSAIAQLRPSISVTGIIAAAENFPGPDAQRPGDIFVAKNGKSIMVDNTDAEGRLVLTDALARAGEEKATHIVDAATLTGSVVRALGTSVAGIMGTDSDLVKLVIDAGKRHGEIYWELPLVEEYRAQLKTPYADLNNIGGKYAGAITAGLFLSEFVPSGASWVHLDIAGPFIIDKKWKYYSEGATGFGVKTFVELAELL